MNPASVVVTCEVVGTLNHYKLCALRGDIKNFSIISSSLALALALALLELELVELEQGVVGTMMWWQWASPA